MTVDDLETPTLDLTPADIFGRPIAAGDLLVCPRNMELMVVQVDHVDQRGLLWVRTVQRGRELVDYAPVRMLRVDPQSGVAVLPERPMQHVGGM